MFELGQETVEILCSVPCRITHQRAAAMVPRRCKSSKLGTAIREAVRIVQRGYDLVSPGFQRVNFQRLQTVVESDPSLRVLVATDTAFTVNPKCEESVSAYLTSQNTDLVSAKNSEFKYQTDGSNYGSGYKYNLLGHSLSHNSIAALLGNSIFLDNEGG